MLKAELLRSGMVTMVNRTSWPLTQITCITVRLNRSSAAAAAVMAADTQSEVPCKPLGQSTW